MADSTQATKHVALRFALETHANRFMLGDVLALSRTSTRLRTTVHRIWVIPPSTQDNVAFCPPHCRRALLASVLSQMESAPTYLGAEERQFSGASDMDSSSGLHLYATPSHPASDWAAYSAPLEPLSIRTVREIGLERKCKSRS